MNNLASDKILVTCECAPNIALIKYWGKSNEDLILPLNSSISITLDRNILNTKTSVMLLKKINQQNERIRIKFWFNKTYQEFYSDDSQLVTTEDLINKKRFFKMLNKIKENCLLNDTNLFDIHISTQNNFPHACGLASSASGLACLALCLAYAYQYKGDITELARIGSGSACRSCYGGFVKWYAPSIQTTDTKSQSESSIAKQLFKYDHWESLNILILILEDRKKDVSSTNGMKQSTQTSELLKARVKLVEEKRLEQIEDAIKRKDFHDLSLIIMQDSNNFHSICMDTYPPLFYLNEKSKDIINLCNEFNKQNNKNRVAYSFDAGPNAFIFVEDENLFEFLALIKYSYFSSIDVNKFISEKLINRFTDIEKLKLFDVFNTNFDYYKKFQTDNNDFIKYLLHSKIGGDVNVVLNNDYAQSLLNENGEPLLEEQKSFQN